jgi:putative acetyltransferase
MEHAAVRAMSIEDYDAVHALWLGTPGVGLSESDTRAGTKAFLARNAGMSAVALARGELVGAVLCGHDGRRGYLHHLAVASAWRGRGIARQLLAWCMGQLSAHGIPKCNIFLFSDNAAGAAFWLHNGWLSRADLQVLQKAVPPSGRAAAYNRVGRESH